MRILLYTGLALGFLFPCRGNEAQDIPMENKPLLKNEDVFPPATHYFKYIRETYQPKWEEAKKLSLSSSYWSDDRKKQLERYLRELHVWLSGRTRAEDGSFFMELVTSRVSGDLGAGIFYFYNERNVTDVGILPVMFVYKDNKWQITPFVSSFSNSFLPPDAQTEKNIRELESWAALKPAQLEMEALKKGDRLLEKRLDKIRTEKNVEQMTPLDLLGLWEASFKASQAEVIAAISQLKEISDFGSRSRWEQARAYVVKKPERASFPLSFLLLSSSTLTIPMEDKDGNIALGILDFNAYFPSDEAVFLLKFSTQKYKKGKMLLVPKIFQPQNQPLYRGVNSDESNENLQKIALDILRAYTSVHKPPVYKTAEEFMDDYTKVFSQHNISVDKFISLIDQSYLESVNEFEKVREIWQGQRSTREYSWRMSNENKGWLQGATKSTRVIPLDEENMLFMLTWSNPLTAPQLYGIHAVMISKKGGNWFWNLSPDKKFNINRNIQEFHKHITAEIEAAKSRLHINISSKDLPDIPEKPLDKSQINEVDESLNEWLSGILAQENPLEYLMLEQKDVVLLNKEKNPVTYSRFWKTMEEENPAFYKDVKKEGSQDIRTHTAIVSACSYENWGLIGISIRGIGEGRVIGIPMIKYEGKWRKISLNQLYSGKGRNIMSPVSMPMKKNTPYYDALDKAIYLPMLQSIIDRKLLPASCYEGQ